MPAFDKSGFSHGPFAFPDVVRLAYSQRNQYPGKAPTHRFSKTGAF
jgi:hypothetical protein